MLRETQATWKSNKQVLQSVVPLRPAFASYQPRYQIWVMETSDYHSTQPFKSPPAFESSQLRAQSPWSRDKTSLLCPTHIPNSQTLWVSIIRWLMFYTTKLEVVWYTAMETTIGSMTHSKNQKKSGMTGKGRLRLGTWSNNHFYCFLPWEIKNHIKKKEARSRETGVVKKITDRAYTSVWPLNQAEYVTCFQFFPFKHREASGPPQVCFTSSFLTSGPNRGGSLPTLSSNPANVSAGPSHVPVLLLANTRQLQQTLE